jgi:hypothetical protein
VCGTDVHTVKITALVRDNADYWFVHGWNILAAKKFLDAWSQPPRSLRKQSERGHQPVFDCSRSTTDWQSADVSGDLLSWQLPSRHVE